MTRTCRAKTRGLHELFRGVSVGNFFSCQGACLNRFRSEAAEGGHEGEGGGGMNVKPPIAHRGDPKDRRIRCARAPLWGWGLFPHPFFFVSPQIRFSNYLYPPGLSSTLKVSQILADDARQASKPEPGTAPAPARLRAEAVVQADRVRRSPAPLLSPVSRGPYPFRLPFFLSPSPLSRPLSPCSCLQSR